MDETANIMVESWMKPYSSVKPVFLVFFFYPYHVVFASQAAVYSGHRVPSTLSSVANLYGTPSHPVWPDLKILPHLQVPPSQYFSGSDLL